ncbi:MAG: ATP-binding protein [Thermoguttaceae bacterium]
MSDTNTRTIDRMMVRIEHLDKLLNLAGEVIITSSTLHEVQRSMVDAITYHRPLSETSLDAIKTTNETTRRISQDLHDLVMAIRMVEIGETFRLFRRPVRDLSRALSKEIELKTEGDRVLVDKALSERLVEPLLHLIRNAADHGLESPMQRVREGKKEKGTITLTAIEHESETEILVSDDGRGVDEEKVYERARRLGLIGPNENPDLLTVLCISGFSTREKATDTSGRGVGLDLVREMVSEFGGRITIHNQPGVGFTFRMLIPKLKAVNIIDALIVRGGTTLFAFPIDKVLSLVSVQPDHIQASMDRDRFIRYRGEPIALFDLRETFGGPALEQENPEIVPVVILEGKQDQIAVVVSEFHSPQKLVNVPINTKMFGRTAQGIAGTCIISEGRIGLTVDVDVLVALAVGVPLQSTVTSDISTTFGSEPNREESTQRSGTEGTSGADRTSGSLPNQVMFSHSEDELLKKQQLSLKRDAIANTLEETGQKELSATDVNDLLDELSRGLEELQNDLLSLESNVKDAELLKGCFRRLHAAKGNFTMLGADHSSELAHGLETLLDYLRTERLTLTQELMDLLLDGVGELIRATKMLPATIPPPASELLGRIDLIIRSLNDRANDVDPSSLLNAPFELNPHIELQLIGALKQGAYTYETFVHFTPGRQADYLIAYLTLRKLCMYGTVLASLPTVADLENGHCSGAIKVLWASSLDEEELKRKIDQWSPLFNIAEHQTIRTTVFRYDTVGEM